MHAARGIGSVLAAALLLAAAGRAPAAEEPPAPLPPPPPPREGGGIESIRVGAIEFEGNRRYSTENLRYSMRTKSGALIDRNDLARDIAMLRTYFEEFSFREVPAPGGVVNLVFKVVENPVVSRVEFLGNESLREEELRALVDTRPGYPLAGFRLDRDVLALERRYRDEGWHWIQVKPEVQDDEGARRVVFRVVEGPKVDVADVVVEGARAVPAGRIVAQMFHRPSDLGEYRFFDAPFVEGRLEEDRIAVEKYCHDLGFLRARAWIRSVDFDEDRDEATISVVLEEGERWTVGEVQVQGGEALADRPRLVAIADRLVPGQPWLRKDVARVEREMQDEARRQGYSEAVVEVIPVPRAEGAVQDVRFLVHAGSRYSIRFLDVSGNVLTQDRVVLREFTVAPGDPLDSGAVAKSVRRVLDTQFFSSAAPVYKETDDAGWKDVEIRVEENLRTSQLRIGAGISSDTGFFGNFSVTFRNFDIADPPERLGDFLDGRAFKGAGQILVVDLRPGAEFSSYRLAFTEPWFLDRPLAVGFDLYATESTRFEYDEDVTGIGLSVQRRWLRAGTDLDDDFSVTLRPRVESIVIGDVARGAPPNAFGIEGRNTVHAASLEFYWRRLDQEHATERGWRGLASTELGGGALGGDFDFWKNTAELTRVFTVWRDFDERAYTLKIRGSGGVVTPLGDGDVPLVERLFAGGAGGIGSVRGYEYRGLGPHGQGNPEKRPWRVLRSLENNHGEAVGGEALLAGTVEYGFPLFGEVLRGCAFVDGGNLGTSTGDLRRNWRAAWGVGILVRIPFLGAVPLRFDFAWPLKTVDGDERQVLSFEFETYF